MYTDKNGVSSENTAILDERGAFARPRTPLPLFAGNSGIGGNKRVRYPNIFGVKESVQERWHECRPAPSATATTITAALSIDNKQ
jgi:hypothetical protein